MPNNLCCVLAPAGAGGDEILAAVHEAGLDPVFLETLDLDQLILCSFAVIDLATGAPDLQVDFQMGVGARSVSHPGGTVVLREPGDVSTLARRLREAREAAASRGPLGPLGNTSLDRLANDFVGIQHTKTDVFRDLAHYSGEGSEEAKRRLEKARRDGPAALRGVEAGLGDLKAADLAVLIDLMLSYRAVKAWDDVIRLVGEMPRPLAEAVMVQEQLGFALNRAGRGAEAEAVLFAVLAAHGPSSETWALLGRVYKDRWDAAAQSADPGDADRARQILDQAIDAYRQGFEADWRDALPGINTVTLMELREPPDPRRQDLLPVVAYAVERRIAAGTPDYWDYATRIELAVLGRDEARALQALEDARGLIREIWEPETTRRNLRLIREVREKRGDTVDFEKQVEAELEAAGK